MQAKASRRLPLDPRVSAQYGPGGACAVPWTGGDVEDESLHLVMSLPDGRAKSAYVKGESPRVLERVFTES